MNFGIESSTAIIQNVKVENKVRDSQNYIYMCVCVCVCTHTYIFVNYFGVFPDLEKILITIFKITFIEINDSCSKMRSLSIVC